MISFLKLWYPGVSELIPYKARMSSVLGDKTQGPSEPTWVHGSNCIDGRLDTTCSTQAERRPWISFWFPYKMAVKYVYIYNTNSGKQSAQRLRNLEVRFTDHRNKDYQKGYIGEYKGPGRDAEIVKIKTLSNKTGSVLYIQALLSPEKDFLNLAEVKIFGNF